MDEANEATASASASPRSRFTGPRESASLLIRKYSPAVGAADRCGVFARPHRPYSGRGKCPKPLGTSGGPEIDALVHKKDCSDTWNTAAADLPIARLATALAASSLRLAAAAEEGLESSPSHSKADWCSGIRGPPSDESNAVKLLGTFEPATQTTTAEGRCKNSSASQAGVHLGTAMAKGTRERSSTASSRNSHDGLMQHMSTKKPLGSYIQQHTRKPRLRRMKAAPVSASPASTMRHTVVPLSQRDMQRCSEEGPFQVAHGMSSRPCRSCRQAPEERASLLRATVSSPNIETATPSNPLPRDEHLQAAPPLPLIKPPSPLSQVDRVQLRKQRCSATVTPPPEEEQFSSLLQHSMLLLKREAARCFASSQASTKQKVWGELQQERLLRLQEQREHQAAAATAAAELEYLRASRDCNLSRTERLLGISCRRKTADDDFGLLVCAWRAWLQHRRLLRRRKQVEKLSEQRRWLLLLLRTFLPWRTAAFRCRAERQQRRAQRLMQQEMQRLEQMHVEGKSRHQQQLLQLHQQLADETWLRQCLQQSLAGVVAGETVGNVARRKARIRSSVEADGPTTASRGVLKAKHKQKPRDQKSQHYLPIRREAPLTVYGMHANPNGREASQRLSKQHQHLERGQSLHRMRQAWTIQATADGASGSESESARSQLGGRNQRVKFVDEHLSLQYNQKLLLLASLLASSNAIRTISGDQALPVGAPNSQENHLRIVNSAFAPASTCAEFSSKDMAPDVAANPAVQARTASGTLRPLQQRAKAFEENVAPEWSAGLFRSSPFELDGQLPKSRRWTTATQF
ncbi:hypothetical protein Emed_001776 [Eimeria media]